MIVTGAGGGLGSIAVAILANLGHTVVASTGRASKLEGYLKELGATRVIGRLTDGADGPPPVLGKQLWSGAIDTVGGSTLVALTSQMKYRCAVASTGVAGGGELEGTVYPFILRGVRLLGVDSTLPVSCDGYDAEDNAEHTAERLEIWRRLSSDLPVETLRKIWRGDSSSDSGDGGRVIALEEVGEWSERLLRGEVQGRVVVKVSEERE